jgi:hypothetical protein
VRRSSFRELHANGTACPPLPSSVSRPRWRSSMPTRGVTSTRRRSRVSPGTAPLPIGGRERRADRSPLRHPVVGTRPCSGGRAPVDSPYDPPHTTINVGNDERRDGPQRGGGKCVIEWEMRPVTRADADFVLAGVQATSRSCEPRCVGPSEAAIVTHTEGRSTVSRRIGFGCRRARQELLGDQPTSVVSFGTEAGIYPGGRHPRCGVRPRLDRDGPPPRRVHRDLPTRSAASTCSTPSPPTSRRRPAYPGFAHPVYAGFGVQNRRCRRRWPVAPMDACVRSNPGLDGPGGVQGGEADEEGAATRAEAAAASDVRRMPPTPNIHGPRGRRRSGRCRSPPRTTPDSRCGCPGGSRWPPTCPRRSCTR